jgi:serine/threonine protein phosphatase PrpC
MRRFRSVGITDIGSRRQNNEDNFLIDRDLGLFLVADGVGGHMAGDLASAMAVATIRKIILEHAEEFSATNDVTDRMGTSDVTIPCWSEPSSNRGRIAISAALNYASNILFLESQRLLAPDGRSMGTTIAGIYFPYPNDGRAAIFNVGDSRLYIFRDQRLVQLTTDHSAYQQWLSNGRSGPVPSRNIITQALGQAPKVMPSFRFEEIVTGDIILMCTDGLWGCLDQQTLTTHLEDLDGDNLEGGGKKLIDSALAASGADNITVLLGQFT